MLIQRKLISIVPNDDGALLVSLKEASIELWHLSELLNERFAYSMLISVTSKLAVFVIDIYWVYIRVIHNVFNFHFIRTYKRCSTQIFNWIKLNISTASALLCVHPLISLIGIFYSCCSATNEYKNISCALHKISSCSCDNDAFSRRLGSFSLQLMTTKMKFTARGFFEITNSTLREVDNNLLSCKLSCEVWNWFNCRSCQRFSRSCWLWFNLCRSGTFFQWSMRWTRKVVRKCHCSAGRISGCKSEMETH